MKSVISFNLCSHQHCKKYLKQYTRKNSGTSGIRTPDVCSASHNALTMQLTPDGPKPLLTPSNTPKLQTERIMIGTNTSIMTSEHQAF